VPYKHNENKRHHIGKQKYKVGNWSEYNKALKRRGDIEIWISEDAIKNWYNSERVYDGTGAPKTYTDFAILACHEVRQVLRLPLRQTEGFINSIFRIKGLPIFCADYTTLSKRLSRLNIQNPKYRKNEKIDESVAGIAIDSSGLKRFGRDEWHQEKHKISAKRSWRKIHIAVDDGHIIQACTLTDRFVSDPAEVSSLAEQIERPVDHVTADGAYNTNSVYKTLAEAFPMADIVIPPRKGEAFNVKNHWMKNRNISEVAELGREEWQKRRGYGRRNKSELAIQRIKRIFGRDMHAREFSRQLNEGMIAVSCLNKMTHLGMPKSYKVGYVK